MMIYCPPFPTNFSVYFYVLDVIACITPLINGFTIFCIVKKSTKQMAGYRWQLLLHQGLAALVDIFVSILTRPVILLPLPLGFPTGLLAKFTSIHPHYQLVLAVEIIILSLVAALQLFFYRYVIASGKNHFSRIQQALVVICYIVFSWPAVSFLFIYEDQKGLLKELAKDYSCITSDIVNIPDLQVYSPQAIITAFSIPSLCVSLLFPMVTVGLIVATNRCLGKASISKRAVYMQRKFLHLLILQVAIPIAFVIIPAIAILLVNSFQIFGTAMLSLFMLAAISCYGASGALLLVYLTPNYRKALYFWQTDSLKEDQVSPASTVWIVQQHRPRIKL